MWHKFWESWEEVKACFCEVFLIPIVFVAVLMPIALAIDVSFAVAGCHARWEDSGKEARFGVLSGCRVRDQGSEVWISERFYRQVEKRATSAE